MQIKKKMFAGRKSGGGGSHPWPPDATCLNKGDTTATQSQIIGDPNVVNTLYKHCTCNFVICICKFIHCTCNFKHCTSNYTHRTCEFIYAC